MLLKAAIPFNFSSPEYLIPHKRRKNRVSPVSRASPAHMNSPIDIISLKRFECVRNGGRILFPLSQSKFSLNPIFPVR